MENSNKIQIEIDKEELSIISQALIMYLSNIGDDIPKKLFNKGYDLHERMLELDEQNNNSQT